MKKILTRILLGSSVLLLSGCNFLDFDESLGTDKEFYYSYMQNAEKMLTHIYGSMYYDFGGVGGATLDSATDDAEWIHSGSSIQKFNDGGWSATSVQDNQWSKMYPAIRSANDFIDTFSKIDFSKFEYSDGWEIYQSKFKYFIAEARVLRALFFFDLAKRYGDIPMPLTVLSVEESNNIERTPFGKVMDFIVKECEESAEILPLDHKDLPGGETCRVSKGTALALRSRALLYKASPLHNESNETELWKAAAEAAQDVMELGKYKMPSLKEENNVNNLHSKELIFAHANKYWNQFEKSNTAIGYDGGSTGTCPTQNLVDAFQTINGYDVTLTTSGFVSADPEFDENKPYANRDPRFYSSILYNGATWNKEPVESYIGGKNGVPLEGATSTGYYLKKYMWENLVLTGNKQTQKEHTWVIFRYAEILLNYAEAMNEAFSSPSEKPEGFALSSEEALNQVRQRAGMPAISGKSQDEMREIIRHERRVEFALEGMRFWDIRRWKIGAETQKDIYGAEITSSNEGFNYRLIKVEERVWNDRMYLYPIDQKELFKNKKLTQNPGW